MAQQRRQPVTTPRGKKSLAERWETFKSVVIISTILYILLAQFLPALRTVDGVKKIAYQLTGKEYHTEADSLDSDSTKSIEKKGTSKKKKRKDKKHSSKPVTVHKVSWNDKKKTVTLSITLNFNPDELRKSEKHRKMLYNAFLSDMKERIKRADAIIAWVTKKSFPIMYQEKNGTWTAIEYTFAEIKPNLSLSFEYGKSYETIRARPAMKETPVVISKKEKRSNPAAEISWLEKPRWRNGQVPQPDNDIVKGSEMYFTFKVNFDPEKLKTDNKLRKKYFFDPAIKMLESRGFSFEVPEDVLVWYKYSRTGWKPINLVSGKLSNTLSVNAFIRYGSLGVWVKPRR